MKILSWNVAGLRAMLKKGNLENLIIGEDYDIICLQETKAEESEVKLPENIQQKYPFRFWNSTMGTTQRKGLSGTTIWCKKKPINRIKHPDIDEEGRITTLQFESFIICCVYTPNSQNIESDRFKFRTEKWDIEFRKYINSLKEIKPTIIAGDLNVAHLDIDIYNPVKNKNKVAGFYDLERNQFQQHLDCGYIDVFRCFHPDKTAAYTYWNQIRPANRKNNVGWRIDYFLYCNKETNSNNMLKSVDILKDVYGSDHCPIYIELNH